MTIHPRTEGILDVVTLMGLHDTIVVLPTLGHANEWWRVYRTAVTEMHGGLDYVIHSKTAVTSRASRTALRLWVPYTPEPTMYMDFETYRTGFDYVSPFFERRELKWLS